MNRITKRISAIAFVPALALSAAVGAAEFTLCTPEGAPYCDGVSLTVDKEQGTVFGNLTGCFSGGVAGFRGVTMKPLGLGASYGYSPSSDAAGIIASTVLSGLKAGAVWKHVDYNGTIYNSGVLCAGAPTNLALRSTSSFD